MIDSFISRSACNTYFLYNENKQAILIDPGYNVNNCLIDHIHKLGVDILAVLITHGHFDHIDALEDVIKEFPKAVTYMSEDELGDPGAELTQDDKIFLAMKWGRLYKPNE